ncbi:MAG: hypothetical protein WCI77_08105 [Candidatus Omnitrophota bacterium]
MQKLFLIVLLFCFAVSAYAANASYVIKSVRVDGETLWTEVEYTFIDGSKKTIDVPHFQPKDKDTITQGIVNREASEKRKIDAQVTNEALKAEIYKDVNKSIAIIK